MYPPPHYRLSPSVFIESRFGGICAPVVVFVQPPAHYLSVSRPALLGDTGPARSCALWTRSPSPSTSRRPLRRNSSRRRWRRCPIPPCCSPWRCRSATGSWRSTYPHPPLTGYGMFHSPIDMVWYVPLPHHLTHRIWYVLLGSVIVSLFGACWASQWCSG